MDFGNSEATRVTERIMYRLASTRNEHRIVSVDVPTYNLIYSAVHAEIRKAIEKPNTAIGQEPKALRNA